MTGDELLRHRLAQLEEWRVDSAATVRSTERDVDLLKLEGATVKGLLVELRTEMRERDKSREKELADRDERHAQSLDRIHQRLDGITTAESFEKGREAGTKDASGKTWRVVSWSIATTVVSLGVVVALLNLILH